MNQGTFKGKIVGLKKQYETYGKQLVDVDFEVKRISGYVDTFIVTIQQEIYKNLDLNKFVEVHGSIRSINEHEENGKSHLKIFIYASNVFNIENEEYENIIEFEGHLAKTPILRNTPFNREICDIFVAINTIYNKTYYIPCIAWESNARFISKFFPNINQILYCNGRLQSREYNKMMEDGQIITKTAFEVSINSIQVKDVNANE